MINYIIISLLIIFVLYIVFIFLLKNKINKLEKKILINFKEKNNLIPGIYAITLDYLNKHKEIFSEILILRKKDFSESSYYSSILEKSQTFQLIHRELDFIFRICNKNPKLNKNPKFNMVKDDIIDKSNTLGKKLELYKKISSKINKLIFIKNLTLIGLLIPIKYIKKI